MLHKWLSATHYHVCSGGLKMIYDSDDDDDDDDDDIDNNDNNSHVMCYNWIRKCVFENWTHIT